MVKAKEKVNRKIKAEEEEKEITLPIIIINRRKSKIIKHLMILVNKKIQDQLEADHKHKKFEEIVVNNKRKYKKRNPIINKKRY